MEDLGCYWLNPPFYDVARVLWDAKFSTFPSGLLRSMLHAAVARYSHLGSPNLGGHYHHVCTAPYVLMVGSPW